LALFPIFNRVTSSVVTSLMGRGEGSPAATPKKAGIIKKIARKLSGGTKKGKAMSKTKTVDGEVSLDIARAAAENAAAQEARTSHAKSLAETKGELLTSVHAAEQRFVGRRVHESLQRAVVAEPLLNTAAAKESHAEAMTSVVGHPLLNAAQHKAEHRQSLKGVCEGIKSCGDMTVAHRAELDALLERQGQEKKRLSASLRKTPTKRASADAGTDEAKGSTPAAPAPTPPSARKQKPGFFRKLFTCAF
jgi:hypothetical protein